MKALPGWTQSGFCRCYPWLELSYTTPSQDIFDSRFVEAKGGLHLVVGDLSGDFGDVLVEHATHVFVVAEDEGLLEIKSTSDDVLCILPRKLLGLLGLKLVLEEELFVVWWGSLYAEVWLDEGLDVPVS